MREGDRARADYIVFILRIPVLLTAYDQQNGLRLRKRQAAATGG